MTETSPYDIEVIHVLPGSPDRVFKAFTDPELFARWYRPPGFPAAPETVQLEARVGGPQRFTMVSEADPSFRTGFDGQFTEVVQDELLVSTGAWAGSRVRPKPGAPTCASNWPRTESATRVVIREGPHPQGTADMGRQSWVQMFAKLESLLDERRGLDDVRIRPDPYADHRRDSATSTAAGGHQSAAVDTGLAGSTNHVRVTCRLHGRPAQTEDRTMPQFSVNPTRVDPYKNFKFRVTWDGRYVTGVSRMSSLRRTTGGNERNPDTKPLTASFRLIRFQFSTR